MFAACTSDCHCLEVPDSVSGYGLLSLLASADGDQSIVGLEIEKRTRHKVENEGPGHGE